MRPTPPPPHQLCPGQQANGPPPRIKVKGPQKGEPPKGSGKGLAPWLASATPPGRWEPLPVIGCRGLLVDEESWLPASSQEIVIQYPAFPTLLVGRRETSHGQTEECAPRSRPPPPPTLTPVAAQYILCCQTPLPPSAPQYYNCGPLKYTISNASTGSCASDICERNKFSQVPFQDDSRTLFEYIYTKILNIFFRATSSR